MECKRDREFPRGIVTKLLTGSRGGTRELTRQAEAFRRKFRVTAARRLSPFDPLQPPSAGCMPTFEEENQLWNGRFYAPPSRGEKSAGRAGPGWKKKEEEARPRDYRPNLPLAARRVIRITRGLCAALIFLGEE